MAKKVAKIFFFLQQDLSCDFETVSLLVSSDKKKDGKKSVICNLSLEKGISCDFILMTLYLRKLKCYTLIEMFIMNH